RLRLQEPAGELEGYSVGQILTPVDCLHRARTQVASEWQPINEFGDFGVRWPFVLDRRRLQGDKLFRIAGHSVCIVIREDLATRMIDAGFTEQCFEALEVE